MIAPLLLWLAGASADDFERGIELAKEQRWAEAREAFTAGARNAPRDKRFPLELAGLEYRGSNYGAAKRYLHRALRLDPADRYANDFLGTLYFLDGNVEAALEYWNRIGKPRLDHVRIEPPRATGGVLLDRALAFSPAGVLTLREYLDTRAWLDALRIFPRYNLELSAQPDERFDATLRWAGPAAWMNALAALRGVAYQTVLPEFRDLGGLGLNWSSLARWDARKRRLATSLEAPLAGSPKWRWQFYGDARRETWNRGGPEDFRLEKVESGAQIRAIPNERLSWTSGVAVASRHFANAPQFEGGLSLEYRAGIEYAALRVPERRFLLLTGATWDVGRMFSGERAAFSRGQASLAARWFPQARGEDYAIHAGVRAGKTWGQAPFDELFILGVERDNDLWLRGHAGTRDGKKGSAPMGRDYILTNWELDKEIWRSAFFSVRLGPFLDMGRVESGPWLMDPGVQCKIRVAGSVTVAVSYGRDLRGGGKALYATAN